MLIGTAEKDLEEGLVAHIQKFLLELGQGFAFMGRQYPIEIDGDTSYIDLLFYHVKLKCYIVIELKARPFKSEDTGQLNYYLSAVDDLIKGKGDNPTIAQYAGTSVYIEEYVDIVRNRSVSRSLLHTALDIQKNH